MSSPKDYILEISEVENNNVATYSVRGHASFFLKYIRVPLVTALLGVFAALLSATSRLFGFEFPGWGVSVHGMEALLEKTSQEARAYALFQGVGDEAVQKGLMVLVTMATFVAMMLLAMVQEPEDSMMVMKDMGVQLSSRKRWRFFRRDAHKEFIPLSDIIDIVVHEGFHGYGQVIFYMCVLTKAKSTRGIAGNGIKVVFPNFLPRKPILLEVWRSSRKTLYGTTRRHYRRVPGEGLREV